MMEVTISHLLSRLMFAYYSREFLRMSVARIGTVPVKERGKKCRKCCVCQHHKITQTPLNSCVIREFHIGSSLFYYIQL